MTDSRSYVAFAGGRRITAGGLREILPVLKQRFDRDRSELVAVFDVDSGRQVDFDLRGTLDEVIERADPTAARGPGRPRLGVISREVSLLPRHWEWLEQQSAGISGALRRLVDAAIKRAPGAERARRIRAALAPFLTTLAGDRPNYEEASRALFAGDLDRLRALVERWPQDIRGHVLERATEAQRAEDGSAPPRSGGDAVRALHDRVWSGGEIDAIEQLVAPSYTVHSDPGDPWEGQTLDRAGYAQRVAYSRTAFPDLVFTLDDLVDGGDRVAVRWHARGTHAGDLRGLPATGKQLAFAGQTFYAVDGGRVSGHWQVVDRLGFVAQLR